MKRAHSVMLGVVIFTLVLATASLLAAIATKIADDYYRVPSAPVFTRTAVK